MSQRMLLLCGLVGSGKSTFAEALIAFDPNFVRVSQDVLGSRSACEGLVRTSLWEGRSVIIDRQNFDVQQRAHWIKIGRKFRQNAPLKIDIVEFVTPISQCEARLENRTNHETLKDFETAKKVLTYGHRDWVAPHPSEGYERHLQLFPVPLERMLEFRTAGASSVIAPARHPVTYPIEPTLVTSIMDFLDSLPAVQPAAEIQAAPRPIHQNSSYSRGFAHGHSRGGGRPGFGYRSAARPGDPLSHNWRDGNRS